MRICMLRKHLTVTWCQIYHRTMIRVSGFEPASYRMQHLLFYVDIGNETHKGKLPYSSRTKHARPKLRKAIILNCDRDLVNCISACVLNVLNGNVTLTGCVKRKLSKHKLALRKLVYKQVQNTGKKRIILQRGGSSSPSSQQSYPHLLVSLLISNASHVT